MVYNIRAPVNAGALFFFFFWKGNMAYNTSRIQVPTSVRLEIENQAKVMKDL